MQSKNLFDNYKLWNDNREISKTMFAVIKPLRFLIYFFLWEFHNTNIKCTLIILTLSLLPISPQTHPLPWYAFFFYQIQSVARELVGLGPSIGTCLSGATPLPQMWFCFPQKPSVPLEFFTSWALSSCMLECLLPWSCAEIPSSELTSTAALSCPETSLLSSSPLSPTVFPFLCRDGPEPCRRWVSWRGPWLGTPTYTLYSAHWLSSAECNVECYKIGVYSFPLSHRWGRSARLALHVRPSPSHPSAPLTSPAVFFPYIFF